MGLETHGSFSSSWGFQKDLEEPVSVPAFLWGGPDGHTDPSVPVLADGAAQPSTMIQPWMVRGQET